MEQDVRGGAEDDSRPSALDDGVLDRWAAWGLHPSLLDQARVSIIVTNPQATILECNRYAELMYGRPREELLGSDAANLSGQVIGPELAAEIAGAIMQGGTWEGDFRVHRPDRTSIDVHTIESAILNPEGRLEGIISVSHDVTERRRTERRLAVQHAATRVMADAQTVDDGYRGILPVVCQALEWRFGAFWQPDRHGVLRPRETWCDDDALDFERVTRETTLESGVGLPGRVFESGKTTWIPNVTEDDDFPRAQPAAAVGLHAALGVPVETRDEVLGVLEFFGTNVEEPDQQLLDVMTAVGQQLGQFVQRRQAEDELHASEARKSAILEASLDAVVSIDHEGLITEFNPAAEATFGYRSADVLGRRMADLIIPPALREQHQKGFDRYLETGKHALLGRRIELTAMRSDGHEFPVEVAVTRVTAAHPPAFTAFLRDITSRRATQERLRDSAQRFAQLAETLQQSLLPAELPEIPGMELAAVYRPAGTGEKVGGDFYDCFARNSREWALVIGDVCGKGPEAAAHTALLRYTIRASAMHATRPSALLGLVNEALLRQDVERFSTCAYVRVRPVDHGMRLTIATAGHPLPLLLTGAGAVCESGKLGTLLGVFDRPPALDHTTELAKGDTLVLYTDGVTDARRGNERFGVERLADVVRDARRESAAEIAARIHDAIDDYQDTEPQDDLAVLVARVR